MIEARMGLAVTPEGTKIVQLIICPMFCSTNPFLNQEQGNKGFGSMGLSGTL